MAFTSPSSDRTPPADRALLDRMQATVEAWEACADRRCFFLRCYRMMTANMLAAVAQGEFEDAAWVDALLHRFADYYFVALDAYEADAAEAPAVWRLAHDTCCEDVRPLQLLLLGVNAHINYDLVLTLVDLLEPEWDALSDAQRVVRYADHGRVNDVIRRTIDAVQDDVIEPAMPLMDWVDRALGPLDEALIGGLIARWREAVWRHATHLLALPDPDARARYLRRVEAEALATARWLA